MNFKTGIKEAIRRGRSAHGYTANHFECKKGAFGRIIFHYRQGMLANLCHIESGRTWSVPMIFEQYAGEHERVARLFRRAIATLKEEGTL